METFQAYLIAAQFSGTDCHLAAVTLISVSGRSLSGCMEASLVATIAPIWNAWNALSCGVDPISECPACKTHRVMRGETSVRQAACQDA